MCKKSVIVTVLLIIVIFTSSGFAGDKYHWKLAGNENGCQIFTSEVAGKDYIAAKTTCLIPARIEVLETIMRDIPDFPAWIYDCKEIKILKTVDDEKDVFIFWFHLNINAFKDRDMVLKSKTEFDMQKGTNLIYTESTKELPYDSGKGYVRMPSFYSLWTLQWVNRENTLVTFMVDPDLGSGVPSVAANIKIKTITYESLMNMMKMAKNPKYIEAAQKSKYSKIAEDY
ncbi:MAG: START domain-containing protein, partial [Smithella sp.]